MQEPLLEDLKQQEVNTAQFHSQRVEQIVSQMRQHQYQFLAQVDLLIVRARLQEYTEQQCDALVQVAKAAIELVNQLQERDCLPGVWIEQRNAFVKQAQRLIEEVP